MYDLVYVRYLKYPQFRDSDFQEQSKKELGVSVWYKFSVLQNTKNDEDGCWSRLHTIVDVFNIIELRT